MPLVNRMWAQAIRSGTNGQSDLLYQIDDPEDSDDHYVTIYDWKETNPETSHYGTYRWHIGSKSREAVWLVLDVLNSPEDMERLDG